MTIDPKRLADICKLRQEASYGYATANGQVYARDVQELLNDRNEMLAELERQRARANQSECVAEQLRRVLKSVANNEASATEAEVAVASATERTSLASVGFVPISKVDPDVLEGGD